MTGTNKPDLIPWVNPLRGLAILLVVLLHTTAPLLLEFDKNAPTTWWIGNILDSLARPCIPLFLMLSGTLLLGRYESLKLFFSRRVLKKMVVPLIAWITIYLMFNTWYYDNSWEPMVLITKALTGGAAFHLWFLYMLLGVYLLIPVLRAWIAVATKQQIEYFLALWIIFSSLVPVIEWGLGIEFATSVELASGYVGFVVLGYYLGHISKFQYGLPLAALISAFVAAVLLTMIGTFVATVRLNDGVLDEVFYLYNSPNVIVMSVIVFLWFQRLPWKLSSWQYRTLSIFSQYCFPIYLIHMIFLTLLKSGLLGFEQNETAFHPLIGVLLTSVICISLSLVASIILRRLPIVRAIVP
jgi:surface polysaccharide O-acyltransferase-like enzyme